MENLTPFRQGHSGIRWTLLPHQAALEWTSSRIAAVILKHKALWIVQGGEGGNKNKDGGTTQTERLKIWAFLPLSYSQRRHNDHFYAW